MFNSFFHDYEPDSYYSSPFEHVNRKRSPFTSRFGDINNNRASTMNRQREAQLAEMERQRQLAAHRRRLQQQQRPVVYRPKPFEATVDISDFDPDSLQIRHVDGDLVIRSPGNVRYGFSLRRMMLERRVPLPDDVIEDQIQCQVDRYGQLKITAPRKLVTKYESDNDHYSSNDEDDEQQKENFVSSSNMRAADSTQHSRRAAAPASQRRTTTEETTPRTASSATSQQSPPIGTKTEQQSRLAAKNVKPISSSNDNLTESDPDVTVEDEFD